MRMNKLIVKAARIVASVQANSACVCFAYQPKLPESVRQIRKSKKA